MKAILTRFMEKVYPNPETGCWDWTGAADSTSTGYGRFFYGGRVIGAHRAAWLMFRGDIPDSFVVDHLCRNRACVNPAHLEPVTNQENTLRAHRRHTHCKKGHEFVEDNIYWYRGWRYCATCQRAKYWNKKAEREALAV